MKLDEGEQESERENERKGINLFFLKQLLTRRASNFTLSVQRFTFTVLNAWSQCCQFTYGC